MGQSATLYRIKKSDFEKIAVNIDGFNLLDIQNRHQTFEKSFEGLRFVILKGGDFQHETLVQQIFYPEKFIGEEIDYSSLDFDSIPDDFDFDKNAIYYNDPTTVTTIALFLENIGIENFKELFDPDELNKNDIYPSGVWNCETAEDSAFNEGHIAEEFIKLKAFYSAAKDEKNYVLSFIG